MKKRWFEVSHIMGMVYQQVIIHNLIIDAHAALIASMLVFFYLRPRDFFKKGRVAMMTLKGRGLVSPRPLVTYLQLLVWFIRVIWAAEWALCRLICELTKLR